MATLLAAFQTFFREHSEHWSQQFLYQEAWPQLLLQAFLQRVVNSVGRIEREYGLGRGRTDLLIVWPRGARGPGGGPQPGEVHAGGGGRARQALLRRLNALPDRRQTRTRFPASNLQSMTATAATDATDEQLVALAASGDTAAFNQLIVRWERPIFALVYRTLGREEDARDVCQEAFLRAFRAIGGFKGQAQFSSWLYRIALNLCRDWIRKERRVRVVPASDDLQHEQAHALEPAEESVEELIVRRDLGRAVERVMATLPEPQRTAILLKEYHGLTFQEIADLQGCPLSTVKTRLYQGLSALRRQLERNGLGRAASLQERGAVSYPPPAGD